MESAYPNPGLQKAQDRNDEYPEQSSQDSLAVPTTASSSAETPMPTAEGSNEAHILNQPQTNNSTQSRDAQEDKVPSPEREIQTCWICQMDDTDDGPQASPWRSPCPCSLRAHESCLMEWIAVSADKEMAPKIVCPVCKYQLKIDQPKDYLVLMVDKMRRMAETMVLPTAAGALFSCFYSGSLLFGVNSLALVFGADEARGMILTHYDDFIDRPVLGSGIHLPIRQMLTKYLFPFLGGGFMAVPSWRATVGLPPDSKSITSWPPSPGRAFVLVPYVRLAYNTLYHHMFSDLEKKWDLAVQRKPREGETAEQIAAEQRRGGEGDGFLALEMEMEIIDEVMDEDGNLIPQDDAAMGDRNQNQNGNQGGRQGENGNQNNMGVRRNISTHSLSFQFMGAVLFPAISSIMGDALKYALPSIWVKARWGGKPGLLQQKWARSLVGGCLFVVLKDVVVLYCKWKKARNFGKKKVLEFGGKGKGKAA
ncbi:hypothetical protein ACHAPF_002900 [Botrytis cinerea]